MPYLSFQSTIFYRRAKRLRELCANPTHSERKSNSGMTLVELLIVVALIGILVGFVAPSVVTQRVILRANHSVNRLASELILARTKAVSQNNPFIITFTSSTSYKIHDDDDADDTEDTGEELKVVNLDDGIQFGANTGLNNVDNNPLNTNGLHWGADSKLTFSSKGRASESGSAYLMPTQDLGTGKNNRMRAVSVLQSTGRVKIWRYNSSVANPGPWE